MPKCKQQAAGWLEALPQQRLGSFQQRHNTDLHILCSSAPDCAICYCTAERWVTPFLCKKKYAEVMVAWQYLVRIFFCWSDWPLVLGRQALAAALAA
jgi:hypothetical protein